VPPVVPDPAGESRISLTPTTKKKKKTKKKKTRKKKGKERYFLNRRHDYRAALGFRPHRAKWVAPCFFSFRADSCRCRSVCGAYGELGETCAGWYSTVRGLMNSLQRSPLD